MRWILVLLLVLAWRPETSGGQPLPEAEKENPVFSSTTRLVELSVSVTDAKANPVTGLTRDDFMVRADGRPQTIAFLHFDGIGTTKREVRPLPAHVFTNRAEFLPSTVRNVTAIVIDSLNSSQANDLRTRRQLMRYLREMPPGSRVALYHLGTRLRVLHDFTEDPEVLRTLIANTRLTRLPGAEEDFAALQAETEGLLDMLGERASQWQETLDRMLAAERLQQDRIRMDRMEMAYTSMMALARHLSTVPGRKTLIWAGGGLPLIQVMGHLAPGPHNSTRSFADWIQATSRRLAEANVVLYYFDTRGVVVPSMSASSQHHRPLSEAERINQDAGLGTTWLANATGGRYVQNNNDVAAALEAAEADLRGSYTLAFYADSSPDKAWVPLEVRVKRQGAKVRHREGYGRAGDTAAHNWSDEALAAALRNPLGSDGVLMNARCEPDEESPRDGIRLFLQVDAETLTLMPNAGVRKGAIEIAVAELSADGRIFLHRESAALEIPEAEWRVTRENGVSYARRWKPSPEAVRLRVLVRDATSGQTGTLDMPLREVRDPSQRKP